MPLVELGKPNNRMRQDKKIHENRFKRFQFFSVVTFALINAIVIFFICFALLIIKESDKIPLRMRNMTDFCDDPQYNVQLQSAPSKFFAYFMVILVLLIVLITTITKFVIFNPDKKKAWLKITKEIATLIIHFMLFCILMELVKILAGVPSPYYFSNKDLHDLHCLNPPVVNIAEDEITPLEKSMRTSFPSYRAAIFSYCITFLFLYMDHHDISTRIHTAQQLVLLIFGGISMHLLLNHIDRGENHISDVTVGVIIGICYGIITIRNLFGTVFYQRRHIWIREEEKAELIFETEYQHDLNTARSGITPDDKLNEVVVTAPPTKNGQFKYSRVTSDDMVTSV